MTQNKPTSTHSIGRTLVYTGIIGLIGCLTAFFVTDNLVALVLVPMMLALLGVGVLVYVVASRRAVEQPPRDDG